MKRLLQAYHCKNLALARDELCRWYRQPLGVAWERAEKEMLGDVLADRFGYHLLQIGRPMEGDLCADSRIKHRMILTVGRGQGGDGSLPALYGEPERLPLASASLDVVVLPHVLSLATQPHEVLREVERVLIPEGHVLILGFNPWSLFGLRRLLAGWRGDSPWCGHFYSAMRIRDWLRLLGFDIEMQRHYFYRPPLSGVGLLRRLDVLESWGQRLWPLLGGGYMLMARKRVTTLTPIKPRWRSRRLLPVGSAEPTARRNQT